MKRRIAELPLHGGKAPAWLFRRMTDLAGAITMAVVEEYGPAEMLRRLADPWWFQALGCVLGFDWHSSGLTTVTCGALKEAQRRFGPHLGIVVAGGKGRASRRTPEEIARACDRLGIAEGDRLVHASRTSAKVDSAAVQDGYQVYHHTFFLEPGGGWCVVQQGMNPAAGLARRYHWLGESVFDFVCEPHLGIETSATVPPARAPAAGRASGSKGQGAEAADPGPSAEAAGRPPHASADGPAGPRAERERPAASAPGPPHAPDGPGAAPLLGAAAPLLNLVAAEGEAHRRACAALVRERPDRVLREVRLATEGPTLFAPRRHHLAPADVDARHLERLLRAAQETGAADFAALLGLRGVGAAAIRSLALVAELIYGTAASRRDPALPPPPEKIAQAPPGSALRRRWADYAYAHGGKDGHPFPVRRRAYDRSVAVLLEAVRRARIGDTARTAALKRLARLAEIG